MNQYLDLSRLLNLPILASEHGKNVDHLIIWVHWLMIALFAGWIFYFFLAIFKFRASKNAKADYVGAKTHASTYIEIAVAVVEAILLLGLAVPLWAKSAGKFPSLADSTVIRVTAEQFTWNSRYPGADNIFGKQDIHLVSPDNLLGYIPTDPHSTDDFVPPSKEIHVPVNKPVIVYLTSKDVIHSFQIDPMRVTQDAIPGMTIPLHFTPITVGHYEIQCAQLCGSGHSTMSGFFTVDTAEDYEKWSAEKVKAKGTTATSFE
ncbi:MAG: cytochrome c oxidase subunit II [Verrucomicrobiota bacterium]